MIKNIRCQIELKLSINSKNSELSESVEFSEKLSKSLIKHGATLVEPAICVALNQAIAMLELHASQCILYQK